MTMNVRNIFALPLIFLLWSFSGLVFAQQIDEATLRVMIEEEVNRIINKEGVFDEAIENGIRNYILKQQQSAEQTQIKQQRQRAKDLTPVDANRDHIFGNTDASITIVEYSDLECPYCKNFHPIIAKLLENNKQTMRWVYRHFPLDFHNPGALKQAEGSECVAELSGNQAFWKFIDIIYQRTESNGEGFPIEMLRPLAEEIGVNGPAFSKCLDSGRMKRRVEIDLESGKKAGVLGTPVAFLMNQSHDVRIVTGVLSLDRLQTLVNELSE